MSNNTAAMRGHIYSADADDAGPKNPRGKTLRSAGASLNLEPRDERVKSKSGASLPKRYSQIVRDAVD